MGILEPIDRGRLQDLSDEGQNSRIYKKHQHIGLMIAELLSDADHKGLYMKLAKKYDNEKLLSLAKDISTRHNIKNKGAYFMKAFFGKKK